MRSENKPELMTRGARLRRRLRRAVQVSLAVLLVTYLYAWYQVRAEKAHAGASPLSQTKPMPSQQKQMQAIADMQPEALQQVFAGDDSVPAVPYFAALIAGDEQDGVGEGYRFPMQSQLLQPGVLEAEVPVFNPQWMTQTLAIVGDDSASLKWLTLHQKRLASLNTTVIVVSAASEESFKGLQKLVDGLAIVPDSGVWLQSRLVAAHAPVYPLFIGLDGKTRQVIFSEGFDSGGRP